MVRKKNKMFVDSADRTPHYSLRKLSVGVASVLLSTTLWMGANGSVVHADTDTINNNATATVAGKVEDKLDPLTHKDQTQAQTAESTSQASVASAEKQNGEAQAAVADVNQAENKQAQESDSANAEAQTTTANDAQADVAKQEHAAQSQQTAPKAQVPAPKTSAVNKKMARARVMATAPAGGKNTAHDNQNKAIVEGQDQISYKNEYLSSLANQAGQDGLIVNKEDDVKTYAVKKDALDDLNNQAKYIQSQVTKYKDEKATYDAAMKVYEEDLAKWNAAQSSTHTVKEISQGLSFANEHDASLNVTSESGKPVRFIKSSAWLKGQGVYTDGMTSGGNISKSFSDSDISYNQADSQDEGTGPDSKGWGKTYTGVQLKVGEGVVARYTGLNNSFYIDNAGFAHKLSEAQVKYTLNETTAKDKTANIFLSNNPNIALWYGAAGDGVTGGQKSSGRVDLTVDLTFYDENGNPITMGKDSNAWLDMSSLNNGTTKVEYFAPNGNTTMQIPGSTIVKHDDGWYADNNNEDSKNKVKPAPVGWDNPDSADRYYGAAIMELEGNSFHIGQKITKYNPKLTNSRNVYSWFALDSTLATAYKPVEPKPKIAWHEVKYEPQKATVTYIDDTDNKTTLKSDSLEGDSNSVASFKDGKPYTTKSSIEYYENKGYEFVSDDTKGQNVVFDTDSSVDQNYEVHLKHGTVTITPKDKNPVKPGDKINPNDPDPNSPVYGDEVKHDNLVKDAKQTIYYEGAGKDTPEDNVTTHKDAFTRTVTVDKVTGKSTVSSWNKDEDTFVPVTTPAVKGYVADKKQAGGDKAATPDNPEVSDTVVYAPTIAVKPGDSWPSNAQKTVDLTKDVTRTIDYVDAQTRKKVAESKTQTVEYGRTAILNKNTGELLGYDTNGDGEADVPAADGDKAWSTTSTDKKWDKVVSPDLSNKGYQPAVVPTDAKDADDANSVKEATPSYDSENVTVTVTYNHTKTTSETAAAGKQTVTYVYKDKDGKVVKSETVTTDTSAFKGTTTKDEVTGKTTTAWDQPDRHKYTEVTTPVVKGYTADEKSVGGDTVTPDDPNRSYEVVYTPNGSVVPVDPNGNPIPNTPSVPYETDPTDPTKVVGGKVPEVPSWTPKNGKPGDPVVPTDPSKDTKVPYVHTKTTGDTKVEGKQTVTYVYKDKDGKVVKSETVTTDTSAFKGTTTKDEVTGKTTTAWDQPDRHKYTEVTTPVVKGYTADEKSVGGDTVTPDDPNRSYEVVYTPNGSVVPVDPNGNPIPNTPSVPYETDPTDPTKVVGGKVPEVPSWTPKNGKPGDPVVPTDPSKDTKVPYVHTKTTGDTKVEGKQTVTYVYKDKDGKVVKSETVTTDTSAFKGTTTKDEVTGKTTTAWDQPDRHKYTEVTTPVVKGYTADEKSVGGDTVTPDDPNRSYEVVYTPNGSVVPVDPNGNPIPNTPSVPYENDPTDPTKVVGGKVPEVPSWTPKKGQPGDPVVPTDPTKDTKVPYDHTMTPGETTVSGKQTVTYVYKDKDGKVVKTKKVEEGTTFTGKTSKDEVTGETTTVWDQKDHKYNEVTTPVVQGYTADKKSVGGETVTPDDPNRDYTVVYTPNGSIVPVDPNGHRIPGTNPVPYENDPTDPTKVVNGKVPEVPSWTPKKGQPGDPVVPTDPTKDTKVPYVHTKVVDDKVPEVPSWTPKNGKPGDPVKPSDPTKDTEVPDDHTMTPGETTATGKVEGLPEKPAKSAKAPAEKLVKTPVKAPKAVKEAAPAEMPAQKAAQAQDQLPQTGEDNSKAAFGLGLASILGGIGILGAFKRKKKEN
ncbi:mucin-binding protein [Lactobacillus amylovorus]|uniref:mucin-binding protein n=1 Tax=Lactobacillus amylovorus TaxID=1604 RepID=UPI00232B7C1C|nr:GbpC/Spa domain-containing protein [Lactobacillus amylovorus]MDB6221661.1 YSIRK-type signal peptide-containing protein [Lactobacillus amylovorus]